MTLASHELVVDLFAGGGGASTGIFLATGRHPDVRGDVLAELLRAYDEREKRREA